MVKDVQHISFCVDNLQNLRRICVGSAIETSYTGKKARDILQEFLGLSKKKVCKLKTIHVGLYEQAHKANT